MEISYVVAVFDAEFLFLFANMFHVIWTHFDYGILNWFFFLLSLSQINGIVHSIHIMNFILIQCLLHMMGIIGNVHNVEWCRRMWSCRKIIGEFITWTTFPVENDAHLISTPSQHMKNSLNSLFAGTFQQNHGKMLAQIPSRRYIKP